MSRRGPGRRLRVPLLLILVTAALLAVTQIQSGRAVPHPPSGLDLSAPGPVPVPTHRLPSDRSAFAPLRVVGLGDSVTAGSACGCTPFVDLYAQRLRDRTGREVQASNLGVPGQTSAGLLAMLSAPSAASAAIRGADVVTVTIGANDLDPTPVTQGTCSGDAAACYQPDLNAMARDVGRLLDRIRALRGGLATTIQVTGYWNVWKDGAVGRTFGSQYVSASDRLTRLTNVALAGVAAAHQATYVDIYTPFRGSAGDTDDTALLAADGDHPDAQGHALIAAALAASPAVTALADDSAPSDLL